MLLPQHRTIRYAAPRINLPGLDPTFHDRRWLRPPVQRVPPDPSLPTAPPASLLCTPRRASVERPPSDEALRPVGAELLKRVGEALGEGSDIRDDVCVNDDVEVQLSGV
jgi:hypothetical protein